MGTTEVSWRFRITVLLPAVRTPPAPSPLFPHGHCEWWPLCEPESASETDPQKPRMDTQHSREVNSVVFGRRELRASPRLAHPSVRRVRAAKPSPLRYHTVILCPRVHLHLQEHSSTGPTEVSRPRSSADDRSRDQSSDSGLLNPIEFVLLQLPKRIHGHAHTRAHTHVHTHSQRRCPFTAFRWVPGHLHNHRPGEPVE